MNKLIFEHYMNETQNTSGYLHKRVDVPETRVKKDIREFGKIESPLNKSKFEERFNTFKLMTLFVKKEVCAALVHIKKHCNSVSVDSESKG